MTSLRDILEKIRTNSPSERDKGTAFEHLIKFYLKNDPKYSFKEVWTWRDWSESQGRDARDTGIDLVAEADDGLIWAIQCKFYSEGSKIYKQDIDSFFTASGKKPFGHRLIVFSTSEVSEHVHSATSDQHIGCSTLCLSDLEESSIDWSKYKPGAKAVFRAKKNPLPHQKRALQAVFDGLKSTDRGKLIMACGTGKTFTALKVAEEMAGVGGKVLFLVPSLSLLSQALSEWTADSQLSLVSYAVCSDSATGKKRDDDVADLMVSDLAYPATTDAKALAHKVEAASLEKMTVVFSTYHSIEVISKAQKKHGLAEFDLIICDEAHRTTGATLAGDEESHFVKVHNQDFIQGKKRLYMTATPRIFGEAVKTKAQELDATLCSMDDVALFGSDLHVINFSEAVHQNLLSDYKVLVLAVDEKHVSQSVQKLLTDETNELKLDDATKIIGCWKALGKDGLQEDIADDAGDMRRAVAFCRDIKTSKRIEQFFPLVVDEYLKQEGNHQNDPLRCQVQHVDGSFDALRRKDRLSWLRTEDRSDLRWCRILSNARCLSEGVDVPTLDAVLFLNPRKSQVDIVQAVGRVMRKAQGKTRGYIILPIGVPAGVPPEKALDDNERYRVVWQVLQALRAHDDRFEAMINKKDLGTDISSKMEIIAVSHTLPNKREESDKGPGIGEGAHFKDKDNEPYNEDAPKKGLREQIPLNFDIGELERAIYAKIVKKCGNRRHWEEWAGDIAKIAQTHITRITAALEKPGTKERKAFDSFLSEIRDDLNESITESDAIEMLAQHIITKPVFDALFEGYDFTGQNPVSRAMQEILKVLDKHALEKETESLAKFYASVKMRAEGIDNAEGKQKIIVELYDKFFRNAFPKMTEKLGIVYTPIEVVDFIIHSVNDILQSEFGATVGTKGVHILDPFVGTGTFITRLLQSGLIKSEELQHKYQNELHANEIVLLAYYIAAINIEAVYHTVSGGDYAPFSGICLTDTFQLYEKEDMFAQLLVDNSSRRKRQKKLDIRVIVGNPPYSAKQGSANDNNANVKYPDLDESIEDTYAKHSNATNKNALYDSYIRAIRWGADRIGSSGVMAYVSNAGWIDGNAMDGMRKCLAEDFSSIYVFHLRGNQRTKGEKSRREGGKIFGSGSRQPIAITVFVKNPAAKGKGEIYFKDIGDYLSKEEKLEIVSQYKSLSGISNSTGWARILPDSFGDWLRQRDKGFDEFISLGDKRDKTTPVLFETYSSALQTNRDSWCYNSSKERVACNMSRMIEVYNSELARLVPTKSSAGLESAVISDPKLISWSSSLLAKLKSGVAGEYSRQKIGTGVYRPFYKQSVYYDRMFNHRVYQLPRIFPEFGILNRAIMVTGAASRVFSTLMVDALPCLDTLEKGQCFPLRVYEPCEDQQYGSLFLKSETVGNYSVADGVSVFGLKRMRSAYSGETITEEDVFYYVYGILHSEDYRQRYADNLSKQLPRIPCVKSFSDFQAFAAAGRALGDLHCGYESVEPYPVTFKGGDEYMKCLKDKDFRVEGMKFAKGEGKEKDKTTVIYNHKITMSDIPLEAYEYVVNGRSALEWVMDRQVVSTDKASGIVNDANDYATETVGDPAYPLKLFQRVITVSLETIKIVKALPKLDIQEPQGAKGGNKAKATNSLVSAG
jgi:predicted helicase